MSKIHQIRPYQAHKGAEWLHIDNDGTHYNPTVDRQIRVPIGDINELREKLRGRRMDYTKIEAEEIENECNEGLTLTKRMNNNGGLKK